MRLIRLLMACLRLKLARYAIKISISSGAPVPVKIRPDIGAAMAANLAHKQRI